MGRWGVGLGNKLPIAEFCVPFFVTFVHLGRGSVSEGLSGNHQLLDVN